MDSKETTILFNNVQPMDIKNSPRLGTIFTYLKREKDNSLVEGNGIYVIHTSGSISHIETDKSPSTFTIIGDEIYYSHYNKSNRYSLIYKKDTSGKEVQIAGGPIRREERERDTMFGYYQDSDTEVARFTKINTMITTYEGRCVVCESHMGLIRFLNPDGTSEIITGGNPQGRNFLNPTAIEELPKGRGFLVLDTYNIMMMKRKKDDTYQISTLVKLWDGFVPISEAFLPPFTISQKFAYFSDGPPYLDRTTSAIYQLDLQKKKQTTKPFISNKEFENLNIGKMNGFHLDSQGKMLVWTQNGIFRLEDKPMPLLKQIPFKSQYLWNPKICSQVKRSSGIYDYARAFLLSIQRLTEKDKIPETPPEICQLVLARADVWGLPGLTMYAL